MSDVHRPDDVVPIPQGLRDWAREHGSPAHQEWVSTLPDAVLGYASAWRLTLGTPFEPGGTSSWVAPARTSAGDAVVLKVAWRHDESRDEAIGLALLDGRGAARIYEHDATADTAAMLLEHCSPGTTLREAPTDQQHRVIAHVLASVRDVHVPTGSGLRPLAEMCDAWALAATDRYRYTRVDIDHAMVATGIDLFRSLPRTAESSALLLTDLHAGNVLAAQREQWLAIDPKPYLGDPHYDVIQHLLNCADLAERPSELVAQIASINDLDERRVREWLFARCVIEGAEWPRLLDVARALAP